MSLLVSLARYSANETVRFLVDRRGRSMELVSVLLPRSIAKQTQPLNAIPTPASGTGTSLVAPFIERRVPQALDNRGQLGMVVASLSNEFRQQFGIPVYRGASVLEVVNDSAAFYAGISPGDCIV